MLQPPVITIAENDLILTAQWPQTSYDRDVLPILHDIVTVFNIWNWELQRKGYTELEIIIRAGWFCS